MASILAWQHIAYTVGKGRILYMLFSIVHICFAEYRCRHTLILAEEGNQVVFVGSDLAPKCSGVPHTCSNRVGRRLTNQGCSLLST